MVTLAIEVIDNKALALLKEMETNKLIKLKKEVDISKKKIFAGAMKLTNEEYKRF